jgi:hypothetical protein
VELSTYWIKGMALGVELAQFEDGNVLVIDLFILRIMVDF